MKVPPPVRRPSASMPKNDGGRSIFVIDVAGTQPISDQLRQKVTAIPGAKILDGSPFMLMVSAPSSTFKTALKSIPEFRIATEEPEIGAGPLDSLPGNTQLVTLLHQSTRTKLKKPPLDDAAIAAVQNDPAHHAQIFSVADTKSDVYLVDHKLFERVQKLDPFGAVIQQEWFRVQLRDR